jgi:hypothetical protein
VKNFTNFNRYCYSQMVELGFGALSSLAQTWDTAEPDDEEDDGKAITTWKFGCTSVANTFSMLLQRAWLTSPQVCPSFFNP